MEDREASALAHEIRGVLSELRKGRGNTAVGVLGGSLAQGFAYAACVATLFIMLVFVIVETRSYNDLSRKIDNSAAQLRQEIGPQIDQLRAWNDVHTKDIARLQAAQQEKH
jgi:hypothetical protein